MSSRSSRLRDYLHTARGRKLRPGVHDCGTFAFGWTEQEAGINPHAHWSGRYRSLDELETVMRGEGFDSIPDYLAAVMDEIPPARATPGDVMVVEGDACGICDRERVFVLQMSGEIGSVSRLTARRAFKCPA